MATKTTARRAKVASPTLIATVKAVELHRILFEASLFAGTDETVPQVNSVLLICDGTQLMAVATDLYTMGISRLACDGSTNQVEKVQLATAFTLADVTALTRIAKTTKRSEQSARYVTIYENADSSVVFKFYSGESVELKPAVAQFVSWKTVLPKCGSQVARAATSYNPQMMARFAKVAGRGAMTCFSFGDSDDGKQKPTAVTIGDDFFGIIMSVRDDRVRAPFALPKWLAQ